MRTSLSPAGPALTLALIAAFALLSGVLLLRRQAICVQGLHRKTVVPLLR
jgi:hypothetical protein